MYFRLILTCLDRQKWLNLIISEGTQKGHEGHSGDTRGTLIKIFGILFGGLLAAASPIQHFHDFNFLPVA